MAATMQPFETDFRFDMDDSFNMVGSQPMSCPSTANSFSSASSAYDPFTPTSRRSTPNDINFDFDAGHGSYGSSHGRPEFTPSSARYMFGNGPVKPEPDHMSFTEAAMPSTPLRKMNEIAPDYDHMLDINLANQHSMGALTPSSTYPVYTVSPHAAMGGQSFMMTPTHSLSGSEIADSSSSWSVANDSPISFFPQKNMSPHDMDALDMDRHSQSPLDGYYLNGPPSPNRLRAHRKMMVHEIQRKTSDLHRAQIRVNRKHSEKHEGVDVVRRAMCKCDYPGCNKAFRRNEHLKRHKQTFHGEGPNRFSCEFCGKDQFNRQDNLNNHRKLHARPNSRNRGVEFIPAAVPIIEQEERSRKRRAPPKSKTEKRSDDY